VTGVGVIKIHIGTLWVSMKESVTKATLNFVYNISQYTCADLACTCIQRSSNNAKLLWHIIRIKSDPIAAPFESITSTIYFIVILWVGLVGRQTNCGIGIYVRRNSDGLRGGDNKSASLGGCANNCILLWGERITTAPEAVTMTTALSVLEAVGTPASVLLTVLEFAKSRGLVVFLMLRFAAAMTDWAPAWNSET
jgi:hypothetical protein